MAVFLRGARLLGLTYNIIPTYSEYTTHGYQVSRTEIWQTKKGSVASAPMVYSKYIEYELVTYAIAFASVRADFEKYHAASLIDSNHSLILGGAEVYIIGLRAKIARLETIETLTDYYVEEGFIDFEMGNK